LVFGFERVVWAHRVVAGCDLKERAFEESFSFPYYACIMENLEEEECPGFLKPSLDRKHTHYEEKKTELYCGAMPGHKHLVISYRESSCFFLFGLG
jgi:hypothetical protein